MKDHFNFKKGVLLAVILGSVYTTQAQFSAGSSFHVLAGTPVSIDSFTLQPASPLDMSNATITVAHVPVPPAGAGSGSIARVYTINPAISFSGTTGLYYLNSELNGNTPALLSYVYDNGTNVFGATGMTLVSNTNNYVEASTGANTVTLARITSVDNNVPLPVDLLSFTAQAEGSHTLIEWATANEFNCDHFDVERAEDGHMFRFLLAEASKGNLPGKHQYRAYDQQPLSGWNYYRLKQVDVDGRFVYSAIVPVFFGAGGDAIAVFPNPVTSSLNVSIAASVNGTEKCMLLDATGRVLQERTLELSNGVNIFNIDCSGLASGSYFIKVGAAFNAKVIKQ